MIDRDHNSAPSGKTAGGRESRDLVAWRFDVGGDAYALLVWPDAGAARRLTGRLSLAEREVVQLIATGSSNATIAQRRGSSPRTVANQVASIFRKLRVHSRLELYALLARSARSDAE